MAKKTVVLLEVTGVAADVSDPAENNSPMGRGGDSVGPG